MEDVGEEEGGAGGFGLGRFYFHGDGVLCMFGCVYQDGCFKWLYLLGDCIH